MLFQVLSSIGVDYKYGGSSHATGFDCSGLVAHVFREGYGITLPRNSFGQSQVGSPVGAEELQAGDLVFFNTRGGVSHVGIYVSNNKFVHASTSYGVTISDLNDDYYKRRFVGAGRL